MMAAQRSYQGSTGAIDSERETARWQWCWHWHWHWHRCLVLGGRDESRTLLADNIACCQCDLRLKELTAEIASIKENNDKFVAYHESFCETLMKEKNDLKEDCQQKDSKIASLEQELSRLKKDLEEQNKIKSTSETSKNQFQYITTTMDPDEVDKCFRGNQENPKIVETKVATFYRQGLYNSIMSDDNNELNRCDLGQLMVSLSKECYDSAVEVSLKTVTNKLKELFHYQPDAENKPQDFENIHHAYGLLLTQCAKEHRDYESDVLTEVKQKLLSDEYEGINKLFLTNEPLFNDLCEQLIHHSVEMVTISPPMILHTPENFDKEMTFPIANRNPTPPLQWTQPVLMRNLYGHVCVIGRAGNRKDMEQSNDL